MSFFNRNKISKPTTLRPTTKCKFCDSIVRTDRLNHHIRKVHNKSVVTCPLCKVNVARSGLRTHIKNVHEQQISLHEFYRYKRDVNIYTADENCQSLEDLKSECSNHEITVSKLPEHLDKIDSVLKAHSIQEPSNSKSESDVVVITQTRTITLKNPSSEEVKYWLREYKKWI